jgi:iron(III) transport system substrate-binding protein
MTIRLRLAAVALVALVGLAIALAGCGGGSESSITVYNGQHAELTQALVDAFEKETGTSVRLRSSDSLVLATQIQQEGGGSPADVFLAENSPELVTLEDKGLLAPLPRSIRDQVPARVQSADGRWVGVGLRLVSLVYDPAQVEPAELPDSILDLAKPEWKGRVALAPTDSDFPPVVAAVIATRGSKAAADWLAGLKRNSRVYADYEAALAAVNRGDVDVSIINQYYWYRLRRELGARAMTSKLHYFAAPDPGSIANVSGVAVLESSGRREEAERFVRFAVGRAGQRILARSDDYEYPVRPGLPANRVLPPLDSVPHSTLSVATSGDIEEAARLIRQAGFV